MQTPSNANAGEDPAEVVGPSGEFSNRLKEDLKQLYKLKPFVINELTK